MTTGQGRVTNRRLDMRLRENRGKERPADASGATQPSNGLRAAAVPGATQSTNRSTYDPSKHPRLIGAPETEFDRIQRRLGLAQLDNEVARDLLEHAWGIIAILSPDQPNWPAEAFRERIWAYLHDEEAECRNCDHYVVNHEAAGPCAVADCDCQNNGRPRSSSRQPRTGWTR